MDVVPLRQRFQKKSFRFHLIELADGGCDQAKVSRKGYGKRELFVYLI
jgi:hypothetical protein